MTGHYVLILLWLFYGSAAASSTEFASKESCESAAKILKDAEHGRLYLWCLPK